MALRFIHSSDWQIGKVFRYVDDDTMGVLQSARLDAIQRLGELARERRVAHVLVAGDVYDICELSDVALRQPIERMRAFPGVHWHLLPGNHDPQQPFGLWDRLRQRELPQNIILHTVAQPYLVDEHRLALLPAPLEHHRAMSDLSAYMDNAETPEGYFRIGMAHGSVTTFGSEAAQTGNYIDPARPDSARLDYLALGDWHGCRKIGERIWYSGTHETDAFDVVDGGRALLVTIEHPGATPAVEMLESGRFHWHHETVHIADRRDIDALAERLRALEPSPLARHLLRLGVQGALSLEEMDHFNRVIREDLAAALRFLRIDDEGLLPLPTEEDLDRIEQGGFVRLAADRLAAAAADAANPRREIAARALQRLYVEHMKLQAGEKVSA